MMFKKRSNKHALERKVELNYVNYIINDESEDMTTYLY